MARPSTGATSSGPGRTVLDPIVVYGHVDKPNAVVIVKVPTAAAAAAEAHESLRAALLAASEPRTTRSEH